MELELLNITNLEGTELGEVWERLYFLVTRRQDYISDELYHCLLLELDAIKAHIEENFVYLRKEYELKDKEGRLYHTQVIDRVMDRDNVCKSDGETHSIEVLVTWKN